MQATLWKFIVTDVKFEMLISIFIFAPGEMILLVCLHRT